VIKKTRTVNKYPKAFRKMAMERLKSCESVTALSEELGIHRTLLYKWRDQMEAVESKDGPPATSRERELRGEIRQLKRVLADKVMEVDFLKGALQKIEARRQSIGISGEKASTSKSES
jgi:transposase-like protein